MKKYEEPKIEIIVFAVEDIMNASNDGDPTDGWDGEGDPVDLPSAGI